MRPPLVFLLSKKLYLLVSSHPIISESEVLASTLRFRLAASGQARLICLAQLNRGLVWLEYGLLWNHWLTYLIRKPYLQA
jgi:hypothetical protein